jgi:hypothetical protein
MANIDHGDWVAYQPATLPQDTPPGALFARRQSDGVDWYEYVRNPASFDTSNVKLAVDWRDGIGYVVGSAVYDATRLFPAGCIVLEVTDYAGSDPQADFGNKLYDPATDSFSDIVLPLAETPTMAELLDRVAALEAKLGI